MGLKMREIGFQRTYIFKILRGSMPPDPPRKVRLRRTITFLITYEHRLVNLSYAPVKHSAHTSMANASSFCPPKGEDHCDYRDVEKRDMKPTGYKNYKSTYNQFQNNSASSVRIRVRIR